MNDYTEDLKAEDLKEVMQILSSALSPSRTILNPYGLWPDESRKKWSRRGLFILTMIIMFYFSTFTQSLKLAKVWGDLDEIIEILTTIDLPVTVVILKSAAFWYNGDVLNHLMLLMVNDWKNVKTRKELKIMTEHAKQGRLISHVVIGSVFMSVISHFSREFPHTIAVIWRSQGKVKPLYYGAEFYYDVESSPVYEATYVGQLLAATIAATSFGAVDALFAVIVMHLCGQLSYMMELLRDWQGDAKTLSVIVNRHLYLAKFASSIEDTFNLTFLVQLISSSMAISLQGFQLVKATTRGQVDYQEIFFRVYIGASFVFSLFVYCYIADLLRIRSMELGDAAYDSQWYAMPPRQTKMLIIVICRAKKPFELTAGKLAVFSLEFYCKTLKACGGYMSMLLAVKDSFTN